MAQELLLLTAPPAAGKTHLIAQFAGKLKSPPLIIAPLRALVNECQSKWNNCVVMTPEEWMQKKPKAKVVIFDEFHLYFYWGDTFRPIMWEVFYSLSCQADLVFAMTATLNQEMQEEVKMLSAHFDRILWVDHGNQKLKHRPQRYFKVPSRIWMKDFILTETPNSQTNLIFCQYRQEVLEWEKILKAKGYRVWSCVGGEAQAFSQRTQLESPPDFIVATTVLSHGVNLPGIARLYFTYKVSNLDFWIQMVARGGRKGEVYEVFSLENPHGISFNRWINLLAILVLSLRMKKRIFFHRLEQWFLKD